MVRFERPAAINLTTSSSRAVNPVSPAPSEGAGRVASCAVGDRRGWLSGPSGG